MWRTPKGDRILTGPELELFQATMAWMLDMIDQELDGGDQWDYSIHVFDVLAPERRLALLADVAQALFLPNVTAPKHTAVSEGAIAAVYQAIEHCIQIEIDSADDLAEDGADATYWRRMVLAACDQLDAPSGDPEEAIVSGPTCRDVEAWSVLIETIESFVLWDADYDMDDLILDADPDLSRRRRRFLGLDRNYFMASAPDPSDEELQETRLVLRKLLDGGA